MSRDLTVEEIDQLIVGSAIAARAQALEAIEAIKAEPEPAGWTGVAALAAVVLAVPVAGALKYFFF